jgi:hypothetical protein
MMENRPVRLQRRQATAAASYDRARDVGLGSDSVDGDQRPGRFELFRQSGDRGAFDTAGSESRSRLGITFPPPPSH